MTEEELNAILEGEELLRKIDVRTMIVEILQSEPIDRAVSIFYDRLPSLDADFVKRFLYMRRM